MLQKGDKIGDYTLARFLGRGQFGVVWLAEKEIQLSSRKFQHALKFLSSFGDEITLKSVQAEIDTWIEASGHPNVMSVLDMLMHEHHVVIVSEFADGGSLMSWLKQHGGRAPSQEKALEMMSGILSGMEHLHSRMVVHRDLKPDNILLQGNCPRITDFGISRIVSANSMSAVAMGSPFYMSPESFDGSKSMQTDIWAAGVMLFEMLSGGHPYTSDTMYGLVSAIRQGEPNPLPNDVSPELRGIIEKALQKDLADRYQSAAEMRAAIEEEIYNIKVRLNSQPEISTSSFMASGFGESTAVTVVNPNFQETAPYPVSHPLSQSHPTVTPEIETQQASLSGDQSVSTGVRVQVPEADGEEHETSVARPAANSRRALLIGGLVAAACLLLFLASGAAVVVSRAVYARLMDAGAAVPAANEPVSNKPANAALPGKNANEAVPAGASVSDARLTSPSGMVYIEGGGFTMGRDNGMTPEESPARRVTVGPFYMDVYEVTNQQYLDFMTATGRRAPQGWRGGRYPAGQANYPVVGVDWKEATAYAAWKGMRLPTDEEWEFAARGTNSLLYPWGNEWVAGNANVGGVSRGFSEVGKFKGASPFGIYDMVGNAGEWTSSDFKPHPGGTVPAQYSGKKDLKTRRGSDWDTGKEYATTTFRFGLPATGADYRLTGFRCAKDVAK